MPRELIIQIFTGRRTRDGFCYVRDGKSFGWIPMLSTGPYKFSVTP